MPKQDREGLDFPSADLLLETLKTSIEDTFSAMLIHFSEAAHQVRPSEENHVKGCSADEEQHPLEIEYESSVKFEGALNGAVVLRFSAHGAQDVARGLLMLEEGDALELEDICDALGECANLVSGALKNKVLDPVSQFTMSVPTTCGPLASGESTQGHGSTLAYHLTRGQLTAEVWLD